MFEALTTDERKQAVAACEIIKALGWARTASIHRRLRLGYCAAARVMDVLEEEGIIGPPDPKDDYNRPIWSDKLDEALSTANARLHFRRGTRRKVRGVVGPCPFMSFRPGNQSESTAPAVA